MNSEQTIVLLHPFPLSSLFWVNFKSSQSHRVITPDFPGFGSSPITASGYTLFEAALDLEKELNFKNIKEPFVLVGISMGGYWAFEYLRQFPDQVDKLVLVSTRAGVDKPEGRQGRLNMAEKVEKEGVRFLSATMEKNLLGKTSAEKTELVAQLREWISQATPQGVALAQRAMAARRDQTEFLPLIKTKTLIVAGREDVLIPASEAVAMNQAIPGSQLKLMDEVGHLLPVEDPKNFQKLLREFLLS